MQFLWKTLPRQSYRPKKPRISPGLKSFKALFYQIDMRMTHHVQFEQCVPVAVERAFLFFANPGNLPRIMPPETGTELVRLKLVPPPGIAAETATIADRDPPGWRWLRNCNLVPHTSLLPLRAQFRAQWIALITDSNGISTSPTCKRKDPSRVSTIVTNFSWKHGTT